MDKPFVSICCITYNHEQYIKDALEGFVIQQTSFPFEIVISDDCSKDSTRSIITEYKAKYPDLIRDVSPKQNLGIFANFRHVQDQAKGKYVALCEGDDLWSDPLKLQKQVDLLEADETLMLCCTDCSVVDQRGKEVLSRRGGIVKDDLPGRYNLRDFFRDNHQYPTLSVVYRNTHREEVHDKHQHTANPFLGDWTLWICLMIYGDMYYLNEVTCAYRVNPTSATHTANKVAHAKANKVICPLVADVLPDEYADIAADLRDTRWVWAKLLFAYKSEKKYCKMIWAFLVCVFKCPNLLLSMFKKE